MEVFEKKYHKQLKLDNRCFICKKDEGTIGYNNVRVCINCIGPRYYVDFTQKGFPIIDLHQDLGEFVEWFNKK